MIALLAFYISCVVLANVFTTILIKFHFEEVTIGASFLTFCGSLIPFFNLWLTLASLIILIFEYNILDETLDVIYNLKIFSFLKKTWW